MNAISSASASSSQDRVYQFVKDRILALEYKPSQKLRAEMIAAALHVSRTPVREALGRLAQENLVEKTGGWGYSVKPLTLSDVLNLLQVREALEVEAIREALPKIEQWHLVQLEKILAKAETLMERKRYGEFLSTNRAFHRAIAETARNPLLLAMLQSINDRIQMIGAMVIEQYPGRAREILGENRTIVRSIRRSDVASAEASVRAHIRRARETIVQYLGREPVAMYMPQKLSSLMLNAGGKNGAGRRTIA